MIPGSFRLLARLIFMCMVLIGIVCGGPGMSCRHAGAEESVPDPPRTVEIILGNKTIRAVVADTGPLRVKGLLGWQTISEDTGMLLDFFREGDYAIHMQGMQFPIDALWIDSKEEIKLIYEDIRPNSGLVYPAMFPSRYCLEVASGFCKKYGIRAGMKVLFGQVR